jgi:hypothetical protein
MAARVGFSQAKLVRVERPRQWESVQLLGLAISFAVPVLAQTPTPAPTTTLGPSAEATLTPALGDNVTQVLPDRHVTFRLLAPKVNAVEVLIGITSGPYEPQGTTTTAMTKDAKGLRRNRNH